MSERIRLGVIGLGTMGTRHINYIQKSLLSRVNITAIYSRNDAHDALAEKLNAKRFTDFRLLINSDSCDAIIIATNTASHYAIAAYALQQGLHVLVESPVAISAAGAEKLRGMTGERQVFAAMMNQRNSPAFAEMKRRFDDGEIGELQRTHWTMTQQFRPQSFYTSSEWRGTWIGEGGGLLFDVCMPNLDIQQWICGMPAEINGFCSYGKYLSIETEDEVSAFFIYRNGATGTVIASASEGAGSNLFEIVGDRGKLSFDGERITLFRNHPATTEYRDAGSALSGKPDISRSDVTRSEKVDQHAKTITNFLDAINGSAQILTSGGQAYNALSIANAIQLSSWQHKPVPLPLDAAAYQQELKQRAAGSKLRQCHDA